MRKLSFLLLLIILLLGLDGCGGASSRRKSASIGKGRASIRIQWPAASRLIPVTANSLKVVLTQNDVTVQSVVIPRPAQGGTSQQNFTSLPYGTLGVAITAYPNADGSGVVQATGAGSLEVGEGTQNVVTVAPDSTVAALELVPPLFEGKAGETRTVRVSAKDASNAIVLLSADDGRTEAVAWAVTGGAATIDTTTGLQVTVTATVEGRADVTATMKVKDTGETVTGKCVVDISTTGGVGHPESALDDGGFPTSYGDGGRVAIGLGSGAKGTLGSTIAVGTAATPSKVVDSAGNLYAASGTVLSSYTPGGALRWSVTPGGTIGRLAVTKDGRLYVCVDRLVALKTADGTRWGLDDFAPSAKPSFVSVLPNGDVIVTTSVAVYALRAVDLAVRWRFDADVLHQPLALATANGRVFVAGLGRNYALDAVTGSKLWESFTGRTNQDFAAREDYVVATTLQVYSRTFPGTPPFTRLFATYVMIVYDAATGTVRWSKTISDSQIVDGFVSGLGPGGRIYTTFGPNVLAMDVAGTKQWQVTLPSSSSSVTGLAFAADGTVYVPFDAFQLAGSARQYTPRVGALRPSDGRLLWNVGTSSSYTTSSSYLPVAVSPDGAVYVGTRDGNVLPIR